MFFTKSKIQTSSQLKPVSLSKGLSFITFEKANQVPFSDWNEILQERNIYLKLEYLDILDQIPAENFSSRYVLIYNKEKPFAIAYFQIIDFKADAFGDLLDSKINQLKENQARLFEKYIQQGKGEVLMRLLTCGNNLVSGENAFLFKDKLVMSDQFDIIEKLIDKVGSKEKLRGKISAVLVKDFLKPVKSAPKCFFNIEKYIAFNVEPNMVVTIPKNVQSLETYISLYSKKYRHRARSIFKSAQEIVVKNLSLEEIKKEERKLYKLYEQVYEHASFKLIKLPLEYFSLCKLKFDSDFIYTAYYLDGKPIAFSTGFVLSKTCFEAHYIGFDYELNKTHELYQNILYNYISETIRLKKSRLNLGRTASEIKSTVGAKVEELTCYLKPQNTVSKLVLKPFITFLQPGKWVPRNPFKD